MHAEPQGYDDEVVPFIDGRLLSSSSKSTFEVINPSNGNCCLRIPEGAEADVDRAVRSSREAFSDGRWSNAPLSHRKAVLYTLADLIFKDASHLDALDAGEMGKPISESFCNSATAATLMRFYAEAVDKVFGDVYASGPTSFVAQRRIPRGVVAAIVPWNFPTFNVVLKIAPALAAGNCVVLKPSELASRSALRIAHLALQAGIPSGVLNVIPGLGTRVGRALGLHSDVDLVTFTGSTAVGKAMLQYAGQSNMKPVIAECGGKSAQIVFADGVDLDAAADSIAGFMVTNQGQICSVGSRLLVQRGIATTMVEKIAERFQRVIMGDASDPTTTFGPLASAKQCARVMEFIQSAGEDGGRLITGGRRGLPKSGGFFVEPTLFSDVSPSARIAQEEIFGPVLSVIPFETEAEAIEIANGTKYGLDAYVWTSNLSTGMRMAKAVRSSVTVNAATPKGEGPGFAFSAEPFGQSGIGVEVGIAGMESYLHRQLMWINHA